MDITPIVNAVIALLMAVLTAVIIPTAKKYLLPWITAMKDKDETIANGAFYDIIMASAQTAVLAAEEAARKGLILKSAKFEYAERYLEKQGIALDSDELTAVIDAAVYELFNSLKGTEGDTPDDCALLEDEDEKEDTYGSNT